MYIYFGVLTFISGLCLGSFLNCTAMRLCNGEDWVKGRSHCMNCGHELSTPDLIPIISYLCTGGKCRYCKSKVSIRYPLTELLFGLLVLGMDMVIPVIDRPALFIRNLILICCLFTISLVDIETKTIPDGCILIGIITWVLFIPFTYAEDEIAIIGHLIKEDGNRTIVAWALDHVLAAVIMLAALLVIILLAERIIKKEALGGGDIKLFAMITLYLGYAGAYELLLLSSVIGLIFFSLKSTLGKGSGREMPFGPAISLAGYVLLLFSDRITSWYISFL